jgi:hypothetical protein
VPLGLDQLAVSKRAFSRVAASRVPRYNGSGRPAWV